VLPDLSFLNLREIAVIFSGRTRHEFFGRFGTRKAETLLYTVGLAFACLMNLMQSLKRLAAIILMGMIAGCAERPSARATADADYGAPLSIDYRKAIRDHMDPTFFYWRTAEYKFTEPYPNWFRDPEELGGVIHYGYEVDVLINAKNQQGKYTGFTPYLFLFRDNLLQRELGPETGAKRSKRPYGD
jgi:hypothetical protein